MSAPVSAPPPLTDRAALEANRARARRRGLAAFLHDEALAEIQERLGLVNRRFTAPAIVTGWPEIWADAVPAARVVADADVLDLTAGAHDLVIHAMALHWAADPVGQVIQCARALRPDGLFLAVAPGGRTLHELRASLAEAEAAVTGGLSARVLPMAEVRDLGGLLSRAGLALPVADVVGLSVSYRSIRHLAADLRAMGEGNALAARARCALPRPVLREAERVYAAHFPAPEGRIAATMELMFLTGWAPHESQQKPLRPGSAVARLADALNAPPLKD
ncbi:methyltransferase domain-containing protein [Frigidibacter sp. RF13]|uniref:methyltransferase domain-containing protein n=1 Tax=Frigidibacter sp. RF13 TaxID=2997340 RepID=UPI002271F5A4|nr:methyltransferase domain-containing protein [Frigidibacter sp. RF13]MCY1126730.1 methyltransferase domain-containing protein [Frigidibacter sp. RF13]